MCIGVVRPFLVRRQRYSLNCFVLGKVIYFCSKSLGCESVGFCDEIFGDSISFFLFFVDS